MNTTPQNHGDSLVQTLAAAGCTSQQTHAFMVTLVYANCAQCGSNQQTVLRDLRPDAVCCESASVPCYYCGNVAIPQVHIGNQAFCSKACWGDYAE